MHLFASALAPNSHNFARAERSELFLLADATPLCLAQAAHKFLMFLYIKKSDFRCATVPP
jgi:hypothetical protein